MRRHLIAVVLAGSLVGACSTIGTRTAVGPVIENPIPKVALVDIEASYGAIASVAVAYRRSCAEHVIPPSCRAIVAKLQAADNYAYNAIRVARDFVRKNPNVDAVVVIQTAKSAVNAYQAAASAAGGQ